MSESVDALLHRLEGVSVTPEPVSDRRGVVPRAATLKDVAARAEVGVVTASGVLNGSRSGTRVSDATRQRILRAAADLRYHPNHAARSLRHRRTGAIGVLFNWITWPPVVSNPYEIAALEGILQGAGERGYQVMLFTGDGQSTGSSMEAVRERRVDGVLLLAPLLQAPDVSEVIALGMPAVSLSARMDDVRVPWVDVDNAAGMGLLVDHLAGLGHRRIAHVTGPMDQVSIVERVEAFEERMGAHGIEVPSGWISTGSAESARDRARELLSGESRPTAIVAWNDGVAVSVVETAREMGLRVPEDLSVVGFDDDSRAAACRPPLTTVRHPVRQVCRTGTHLLVDLVEGRPVASPPRWRPELVVRSTTASPGEQASEQSVAVDRGFATIGRADNGPDGLSVS
jgi:DNA-binding LacI/PurR family transcriptional regulator